MRRAIAQKAGRPAACQLIRTRSGNMMSRHAAMAGDGPSFLIIDAGGSLMLAFEALRPHAASDAMRSLR